MCFGRGLARGVLLGDALDNPRRERRRHEAKQSDATDHQCDSNDTAHPGDRMQIAISHGCDGCARPPQCVAEGLDLGVGMVAFDVEDGQGSRVNHDRCATGGVDDHPSADGVADGMLQRRDHDGQAQ